MSTVLVMGAGRSGVAAAKFLLKLGLKVTLYDDQSETKLSYFNKSGLSAVRTI